MNTVNAEYAQDCDKLECLLQAKNYLIRGEIENKVYNLFKRNLINDLNTKWGEEMAVIFDEINDHYFELEEKFIKYNDTDLP